MPKPDISKIIGQIKENKISSIDLSYIKPNYQSSNIIGHIFDKDISSNATHERILYYCVSNEGWFAIATRKVIKIYNSVTLENLHTFQICNVSSICALSKNRIAVGWKGKIEVFKISGEKLWEGKAVNHYSVDAILRLPDNKLLAVKVPHARFLRISIEIFDIDANTVSKKINLDNCNKIAYLPKHNLLVLQTGRGVGLWDIQKMVEVKKLTNCTNTGIIGIAITDSGLLIIATHRSVDVWNIDQSKRVKQYPHSRILLPFGCLPLSGDKVLVSVAPYGRKRFLQHMDINTGKVINLNTSKSINILGHDPFLGLLPNGNIVVHTSVIQFPSLLERKQLQEMVDSLKLNTSVIDIKWCQGHIDKKLKQDATRYIERNKKMYAINQNDSGYSLLHFAINNGNTTFQKELLNNPSIDVNLSTKSGLTPLRIAVQKQDIETASRLLKANAAFNQGTEKNQPTALHDAAKTGNLKIINLLISPPYKANALARIPGIEKNKYLTPSQVALNHGYPNISKILQKEEEKQRKQQINRDLEILKYQRIQQIEQELAIINNQQKNLELTLITLKMDVNNQPKLKERIDKLEKKQKLLFKEYQAKQRILKEQQLIRSSEVLFAFYNRVQQKLIELFLACKVISSGKVNRAADKTNKVLNGISEHSDKIGKGISFAADVAGIFIPGMAIASTVTKFFNSTGTNTVKYGSKAISLAHSTTQKNKLNRISQLNPSIIVMDQISEEFSRRLTLRYQAQIKHLTHEKPRKGLGAVIASTDLIKDTKNGGAEDLAECAINRIYGGLCSGTIHMERENKTPIVKQMLDTVFKVQKKCGKFSLIEKNIKTTMPGCGLDKWTDQGVFRKTGIRTENNEYFKNNDKKGLCGNPEKYGYRSGTLLEIDKLKQNDGIVLIKQAQATSFIGANNGTIGIKSKEEEQTSSPQPEPDIHPPVNPEHFSELITTSKNKILNNLKQTFVNIDEVPIIEKNSKSTLSKILLECLATYESEIEAMDKKKRFLFHQKIAATLTKECETTENEGANVWMAIKNKSKKGRSPEIKTKINNEINNVFYRNKCCNYL